MSSVWLAPGSDVEVEVDGGGFYVPEQVSLETEALGDLLAEPDGKWRARWSYEQVMLALAQSSTFASCRQEGASQVSASLYVPVYYRTTMRGLGATITLVCP